MLLRFQQAIYQQSSRTTKADPRVVSVEENKTRKAEAIPSDEFYSYQWALPQIDWDMVFDTVIPTGLATVAVLDTGVDSSHTELAGKLVTCTSILDGSDCTSDPNGHGTWLAGINSSFIKIEYGRTYATALRK